MAGPNLPTTVTSGLPGELGYTELVYKHANKFDKDAVPTEGMYWAFDVNTGVYLPRQQVPPRYQTGVTQGADYTLILSDNGKTVEMHDNAVARTLTIPDEATVAFPIGAAIGIYQHGSMAVTIAPASANTEIVSNVNGTPSTSSASVYTTNGRYSEAVLRKRYSDGLGFAQWVLSGNVVAT